MQRDIIHKWHFPHPPEKVWDFLVKPELIAQWLMENDFQPIVGHQFQFKTYPKIKLGFDGTVYCEVLDVVPFRKLSYSWKGGPGKGKVTLDSIVVWTLTPTAEGTELLLEHKGFKGMKNFLAYVFMNKGWQGKIRRKITELLNVYTDAATNH